MEARRHQETETLRGISDDRWNLISCYSFVLVLFGGYVFISKFFGPKTLPQILKMYIGPRIVESNTSTYSWP